MILDLDTLFPRGEEVAPFRVEGLPAREETDPTVTVTNVTVQGTVTAQGKLFLVSGSLVFRYETVCARCLAPVEASCEAEFDEEFALTEDEENPDRYLYKGQALDLTQMVNDCITLNMPLRTLCREDCKGLCPVCGADRNVVTCACTEGEDPTENYNPFAVLANLREENEEV